MDPKTLKEILENHQLYFDMNKKGGVARLFGKRGAVANLEGADLTGVDLRMVHLVTANMRGANLSQADLRGAILHSACLIDACLVNADLTQAGLVGTHLADADLSLARLHRADMASAKMMGAKLVGACLIQALLRKADLSDANLQRAELNYAHLSDANLLRVNLEEADLTGANLTGADLTGANLRGANLAGAYLTRANLTGADLTDSNLSGVDLEGTKGLSKNNPTHNTGISHQDMMAFYCIAADVIPERLFRDENHVFTGGRTFINSFESDPKPVITELMLHAALRTGKGASETITHNFRDTFSPICGTIRDLQYLIIRYPKPQPSQISGNNIIVGPFYSAFVYSKENKSIRYYILRTNSSGTLSTGVMREILPDGAHLTINTSCPTELEEFIEFLNHTETAVKTIEGGVDNNGRPTPNPLVLIYKYYPDASKPNTTIMTNNEGKLVIPAHWRHNIEYLS